MRQYFIVISIVFSLSIEVVLLAGQNVGGGDNIKFDTTLGWFRGSDERSTVKFCIERSNTYPISNAQVIAAVNYSFKGWQNYLLRSFNGQLYSWSNLSPKFGSCSVADVKIYLGIDSNEVIKEKKLYQNPAAFVKRTKVIGRDWAKGFMWFHEGNPYTYFFPNAFYYMPSTKPAKLYWGKHNAFEILMMHEIGHIFGNGHISGTIMDKHFLHGRIAQIQSQYVLYPHEVEEAKKNLLAIDGILPTSHHPKLVVPQKSTLVSTCLKTRETDGIERSLFIVEATNKESFNIYASDNSKDKVAEIINCRSVDKTYIGPPPFSFKYRLNNYLPYQKLKICHLKKSSNASENSTHQKVMVNHGPLKLTIIKIQPNKEECLYRNAHIHEKNWYLENGGQKMLVLPESD